MVIWFNNDKARKCLLKRGYVYTLRHLRQGGAIEKREVLMWEKFGSRGTVYVRLWETIDKIENLRKYVSESGFDSVEEWLKAAGNDARELYRVDVIELRSEAR